VRIAQIATLASAVGPETAGVGSVEGLVWTLTERLVSQGHKVTVFGAAGSAVAGEMVATLPGPYGTAGGPDDWQLCEWVNLCEAVKQSSRFDLLHSHAYLWGLPLEPLSAAPMVHSLHVWPYADSAALRRAHPRAWVTALSAAQWGDYPDIPTARVVPHGVEPGSFPLRASAGDHACYLGRFIPGKGPLEAIEAARAAGLRLMMAGPQNEFFWSRVAPLVDGRNVEYVGMVTAAERAELLGSAGLLLAPFQAPEPFCLVLAEAMMCGTPAVATAVGAATEIIEPGVTGYCSPSVRALPGLMHAALDLDRSAVRKRAEIRFSAARMVNDYLALYRRIIDR
jgi:glycosyltransferase involved in cell wall biosynthesis